MIAFVIQLHQGNKWVAVSGPLVTRAGADAFMALYRRDHPGAELQIATGTKARDFASLPKNPRRPRATRRAAPPRDRDLF